MPNLEVNIFNQKLKLSYEENEKQRLLKAVEILNNNWNKFSSLHGKVSDLKIATLISLELQDTIGDIQALKDKLNIKEVDNELLKKEIELTKKESAESINTIKKIKSELNNKTEELSRLEYVLEEFHSELMQIKINILKKTHE
jgi:cell division protein ZapA (FtsZ GTPase activity inhibitor)